MSSRFICFLRIGDNKFDIVVNDGPNTPKQKLFTDIYLKINQICKIALNADVQTTTYVFEIIDSITGQSSIIQFFDQTVNHLSVIRLRKKAQFIRPGVVGVNNSDVVFLRDQKQKIKAFNIIVKSIDKSWNFHENPNPKWKLVSDKVLSEKNSGLFGYSPLICQHIFKEIASFYAKTFDKLNLKLEPSLQKQFDIIKKIHTLDVDKLFDAPLSTNLKAIATKPEVIDFLKYGSNVDLELIKPSVRPNPPRISFQTNSLPSSLSRHTVTPSTSSTPAASSGSLNLSDPDIVTLRASRKEISAFTLIINCIDIQWNFSKNTLKKWTEVANKVRQLNQSLKDYNAAKCELQLTHWTNFYTRTYEKFEGKLPPDARVIFDMLKRVHNLNPNKVFFNNVEIRKSLEKINYMKRNFAFNRQPIPGRPSIKERLRSRQQSHITYRGNKQADVNKWLGQVRTQMADVISDLTRKKMLAQNKKNNT